ncbi:hypothetical protein ACFX2I_015300 [Malus domestica]
MELRSICNPLRHLPVLSNCSHQIKSSRIRSFSVRSCRLDPNESHKVSPPAIPTDLDSVWFLRKCENVTEKVVNYGC